MDTRLMVVQCGTDSRPFFCAHLSGGAWWCKDAFRPTRSTSPRQYSKYKTPQAAANAVRGWADENGCKVQMLVRRPREANPELIEL
jgi:hypothetical protein